MKIYPTKSRVSMTCVASWRSFPRHLDYAIRLSPSILWSKKVSLDLFTCGIIRSDWVTISNFRGTRTSSSISFLFELGFCIRFSLFTFIWRPFVWNYIPGHTLSCSDHAEILYLKYFPSLGQRPGHLHVGVQWRHPCSRWSFLSSRLQTNSRQKNDEEIPQFLKKMENISIAIRSASSLGCLIIESKSPGPPLW